MASFSSKEDEKDVTLKVIKKLVSQVPDGPLRQVEEITVPQPLSPISPTAYNKQERLKRGPRSPDSWYTEIRKDWRNIEDVDKLGRSWLSLLPQVQKLAVSKYGGGLVGRGMALKELLTQALTQARRYETDDKTHAMLRKYPVVTIEAIARGCGITREQFSRNYCPKATMILTEAFQLTIGRRSKSRADRLSTQKQPE